MAATGWLAHTTRAALTGLRKRGYAVVALKILSGLYTLLGRWEHAARSLVSGSGTAEGARFISDWQPAVRKLLASRSRGGRVPAQVIAPLQTKPICDRLPIGIDPLKLQ
jgi:hypothetical protein